MLANLINQHASTAAAAGDWTAVATVLNSVTVQLPAQRVTGKQTIVGLAAAGIDSDRIRTVLEQTPSGRGILGLLDAGQSVDWTDPVTTAGLAKNTGARKLTEADVAALQALSRRVVSVAEAAGYPQVTAVQCQAVWTAEQIRARRQRLDTAASAVRSQIESGLLANDVEIVAALQSALEG